MSLDSVLELQCRGFVSDTGVSEGDFDPRQWLTRPVAQSRNAGIIPVRHRDRGPGRAVTTCCWLALRIALRRPAARCPQRRHLVEMVPRRPCPVPSLHRVVDWGQRAGVAHRSTSSWRDARGLARSHVGADTGVGQGAEHPATCSLSVCDTLLGSAVRGLCAHR